MAKLYYPDPWPVRFSIQLLVKVASIYVLIYSHIHANIKTLLSKPRCSYKQVGSRLCQYIESAFEVVLLLHASVLYVF